MCGLIVFRERIAYEMFEKQQVDKRGESNYRLWRTNIEKDPLARRFLAHF